MYRWHIMDPVRFTSDLRITIQALGWRSGGRYLPLQDDLCSTAFWYQTLPTAPFPALPEPLESSRGQLSPMKFVIAVDCEGPAGVVGAPGGSLNDAPAQYEFARRQATAEASAAARGLFAAGATQVIVWDTHGGGVNLVYDELDERCDIFHGANGGRLSMLDRSFSGLLFIGYHARDNTLAAPWPTLSAAPVTSGSRSMDARSAKCVDAAVAGALGVPVLFVASDDKACAELKEFAPGGHGGDDQDRLQLELRPEQTSAPRPQGNRGRRPAAVVNRAKVKPFTLAGPLEVEIRHKRIDTADEACLPVYGWTRRRVHGEAHDPCDHGSVLMFNPVGTLICADLR
jgi:D-amino peptidase